MAVEERGIGQVQSIWINAGNASDLDRLLTLMTDDALFFSPGQAPVGRQAFPVGVSTAHQQFEISCSSELEEIVLVGEVARTLCRDSSSMTRRAGGETTELSGHRMTIYRKPLDGGWLPARDAHTLIPVDNPRS